MSELIGEPPDRRGRDAARFGNRRRSIARIEIALGHELKDGDGAPTIGQRRIANEAGGNARRRAAGERSGSLKNERLARRVAGEQPVISRSRRLNHQPRGVGITNEIVEIDPIGFEKLVDQCHGEEPVSAGPDPNPFVGDRRIAGTYRIDRDKSGAALA